MAAEVSISKFQRTNEKDSSRSLPPVDPAFDTVIHGAFFCFVSSCATIPCSEIERLELMIAETKNSIETYKGQGVSTDTQRKKILRGLEEQLTITEVSTLQHLNTHLSHEMHQQHL